LSFSFTFSLSAYLSELICPLTLFSSIPPIPFIFSVPESRILLRNPLLLCLCFPAAFYCLSAERRRCEKDDVGEKGGLPDEGDCVLEG
jgi:hypothetical protein